MFKCASGVCIPIWWKCDSSDDCGDGSDEIGCKKPITTTQSPTTINTNPHVCKQNQYQCVNGDCIPISWVCDGSKDCNSGEDENDCAHIHHCSPVDEFVCRMDGSCIPVRSLAVLNNVPTLVDLCVCILAFIT